MKRRAVPIIVVALVELLAPHESRAADPLEDFADPTAAQELVDQARALMRKSKYDDACPKLEESLRIEPAIGTRFDLADCNEHIGKIATAWAGFAEVVVRARAASMAEREAAGTTRLRALERRLPKLVIDVPTAPAGLEVKRDALAVASTDWGTAIPVDPGTHRITATAPGRLRWVRAVESREGEITRVEVPRDLAGPVVDVAMTAALAIPAEIVHETGYSVAPSAAPPPARDAVRLVPPSPNESHGSPRRNIGLIVSGLAVIGISAGTGFWLASGDKRDASASHCAGNTCDAAGASFREDAARNADFATTFMITGAAALVGGLVIVFTAPKGS